MADTDEFDKGTLRNATRGIPDIGTANERDAAGRVKDAYSEGKRLVEEQDIPGKARSAGSFISGKVHEAESAVKDWKAGREASAAADRERRKAEAREKTEKYRDELETKRMEAEVKALEAQARSYGPQGGDKVTELRNAMLNMKAEGRKMFSGPASEAMWNTPNPLQGPQRPSPLMTAILTPGRPPGQQKGGQLISPLMRGSPKARMPVLMREGRRRARQPGGLGLGGGSLIRSIFGKRRR